MKINLAIVFSTILLLLSNKPAYSFTFTPISFNESNKKFTWKFRLSGQADPNKKAEVFLPPPPRRGNCPGASGTQCWNISVSAIPQINPFTIVFLGQHTSRVHKEPPFGDSFVASGSILENVDISSLMPAMDKKIFDIPVTHEHTPPPDHMDIYTLIYSRKNVNGEVTFTYRGIHTVPESASTLSLLAFGTLGIASTLKRKINKKE